MTVKRPWLDPVPPPLGDEGWLQVFKSDLISFQKDLDEFLESKPDFTDARKEAYRKVLEDRVEGAKSKIREFETKIAQKS